MEATPWIIEFYDEHGQRVYGTTSKELEFIPRENETIELLKTSYRVAHVHYLTYFRKIKITCQKE